ncbi:MAG: hypothetical protein J1F02_03895 [Lachnospiraceae bacterium]|nr:hypothetical protein [Lachnospiraceae bacterium]
MEPIEEKRESLFQWIGNGKKMIIGGLLLLAGIIGQILSDRTLEQIPFILMSAGLMCFVNTLFSKLTDYNIHLLLFLVINIVAMEIGLTITAADIIEGVTLYSVWVICGIAAWIFQAMILKIEGSAKRAVLSFFETLLSVLALGAALFLPIILEIWIGK